MEKRVTEFSNLIKKLNENSGTEFGTNPESNNNCRTIASYITSLPPKQYTLMSSVIGILLIDNLDPKEQISLGKFFINIGQTILSSAAQEELSAKRALKERNINS